MTSRQASALEDLRDNGAMLFCVDSSHWSKRWIHDQWQHLLSSKNLKALLKQLPEDLRDEVGRDYKMATLLLDPGFNPLGKP